MSRKSRKIPHMQHRPNQKPHEQLQSAAESSGETTTYYIHGPRGIHAQQQNGEWTWMLQGGLGSVRSVVDNELAVLQSTLYDPYGNPFGASGAVQTMYGFTGKPVDTNGLVYLRNRSYNPAIGTFISQDPHEGLMTDPMSLNRYAYVQGNPVNRTDPSGMISIPAMMSAMHSNPLAFAQRMNAGVCYQTTDSTPTPTPCAMRAQNGVNVLAASAYTESDGGGMVATPSLRAVKSEV